MALLAMASYCHRDRELSGMGAQASDRSRPVLIRVQSLAICVTGINLDQAFPRLLTLPSHALAVLREESAKRRTRKARIATSSGEGTGVAGRQCSQHV